MHSDDFQIYFASDPWRQKFNEYVHQITEGFEETGFIADLDTEVQSTTIPVKYVYNVSLSLSLSQLIGRERLELDFFMFF